MFWLLFAVATAFFESLKDLLAKRVVAAHSVSLVACASCTGAIPFVAVPALQEPMPEFTAPVVGLLIGTALLHVAAVLLYVRALACSPMSLSLPMISFTPAFLLLTSPVLTGEMPGIYGTIGVLILVAGAYVVNLQRKSRNIFEPLRAMVREEGPRYMLVVAFIWSITGNLDRIALRYVSPNWWLLLLISSIAIFLMVPAWIHRRNHAPVDYRTLLKIGFFVGGFNALSMIFYMQAIQLALVAYVVSVKRLSILFGILWGHIFFRETSIRQRFAGASLMLAGFVVISFA